MDQGKIIQLFNLFNIHSYFWSNVVLSETWIKYQHISSRVWKQENFCSELCRLVNLQPLIHTHRPGNYSFCQWTPLGVESRRIQTWVTWDHFQFALSYNGYKVPELGNHLSTPEKGKCVLGASEKKYWWRLSLLLLNFIHSRLPYL